MSQNVGAVRMHVNCPNCQNPIEFKSDDTWREVLCPTCGSSFKIDENATTAWDPKKQQRSVGRFELLEILGAGAFGTVYKARDPQLERMVAVKVPRAGSLASNEDMDRFLREAKSVAKLRHPSIVPIHEVGQQEGLPFLVSEFVQGMTLADVLSGRRLAPREAAQLMATVADALQYAHDNGIIHRDVKPSNILLDDGGVPHLMDFGLAKRDAGEVTMTTDGQILGTPAYMSPEQARGDSHQVDGRSDVYSLGVILYQLLTGELPFRGNSRMLLHQVLHDEPRAPRSLNDHVPRDMETICLKAMAKEPGRRYASAADFAADLTRFLNGEPIQARPISSVQRLGRWCRRNPVVAGLTAAVVLVLISATGISSSLAFRYYAARADAELNAKNEQTARTAAENAYNREQEERALAEAARRKAEEQQIRADAERKKAETELYFSRIALAERYWSANNVDLADRKLEECPPGLRNWEWHHLKRLCHAELETTAGPAFEPGRRAAFSRDGQRVAVISSSRRFAGLDVRHWSIQIWDAAKGIELHDFDDFGFQKIDAVAISPDGQMMAAVSGGNRVRLWRTEDASLLADLGSLSSFAGALAFGANNSRLAVADNGGTVSIWETPSGKPVMTFSAHKQGVFGVGFSPDGATLATASADETVKVWDLRAAGSPRVIHVLVGHKGVVKSVLFSPNGQKLATEGLDNAIKVFDVVSGKRLAAGLGHTGTINGMVFNSDGSRLISASDDWTIKAWSVEQGRELFTLRGHARAVMGIAYQKDDKQLVSISEDRTLKYWDAVTGLQAIRLPGRSPACAFSPDGNHVALASPAKDEVQIWNVTEMKSIQTLSNVGLVRDLCYSSDGRKLIVAGEVSSANGSSSTVAAIWDLKSGQRVEVALPLPTFKKVGVAINVTAQDKSAPAVQKPRTAPMAFGQSQCIAISSSGRRAMTSGSGFGAALWDVDSGKELLRRGFGSQPIERIALCDDGNWAAAMFAKSLGNLNPVTKNIMVWSWESKSAPAILTGHSGEILNVTFSPALGGARPEYLVAVGDDRLVNVWELKGIPDHGAEKSNEAPISMRPAFSFAGHTHAVRGLAFSPDGKRLATISGNAGLQRGELKIWDMQSRQEVLTLAEPGAAVVFSPRGTRLAINQAGNNVKILDGSPSLELLSRRDAGTLVVFDHQGTRVALAGASTTVQTMDVQTALVTQRFKGKDDGNPQGHGRPVRHTAFSPDGSVLATASDDGNIKLWEVDSAKVIRTLVGHSLEVQCVTFSPDGRRLISGGSDETAKVWDIATGEVRNSFKEHTDRVLAVAVSPNGKHAASAGDDRIVRVWEIDTGREVFRLMGHADAVFHLAFSPDGRLLASASEDQTAKLWDTTAGSELRTLAGHQDGVRSIAFSRDGKHVATAGWDKVIKIWDVDKGVEVLALRGHREGVNAVSFGKFNWLASTGADRTLRIWTTQPAPDR